MIHKRSIALERSVKIFYWRAETGFKACHANLILSSDVDQDTLMFGLHEIPFIDATSLRAYQSRYKEEIKQI